MPGAMDNTPTAGLSLATRLSEPLTSTSQILDLLVPPLHALGTLPDVPDLVQRHARVDEALDARKFARRQLGLVQKILVERVWPDWETALEAEEGAPGLLLLERFFVPPTSSFASTSTSTTSSGAEIALSAYAVLTSLLSSKSASTLPPRSIEVATDLLVKLSKRFNIEELYPATIGSNPSGSAAEEDEDHSDPAALSRFEQGLKHLVGVPVRAANAWGTMREKHKGRVRSELPPELDVEPFSTTLAASYVSLLWNLSGDPRRRHLDLWRGITAELSERDLIRFLRKALQALEKALSPPLNGIAVARGAACVLDALFGPLAPSNAPVWKAARAVLFENGARWSASLVPGTVAFWAGEAEEAKGALVQAAMDAWGAREAIRSGSDSRRLFLTSLFLAAVVSLPSQHPEVITLSRSPSFLNAVSTHLSLVAPLPRLLGMLVAEVVSSRTVKPEGELKPLSFGDEIWGGDKPEQAVARELRASLAELEMAMAAGKVEGWQQLLRATFAGDEPAPSAARGPAVNVKPTPLKPTSVEEPAVPVTKRPLISIIGSDDSDLDSDDDLQPYALPPAPPAATLEALQSADSALYHSAFPSQTSSTAGPAGSASQTRRRGRLRPPVYVPELVAYLKGQDPQGAKEEADGEAERVEVGLREGEALVRRKAGWGGELSENAVDLAFALMGLQNQFELDDFEQLKQNILVALVVACPIEVAPAVIEQFFTTSYSVAQRHILLASLAFAARELAGLPIPISATPAKQLPAEPLFPSKQLPPALHRRLVGSSGREQGQLEALTADLTRMALSGTRDDAEETLPGAAREKLLSVRRTTKRSAALSNQPRTTTTPTFSTLAAETFILPLINRFWLYLRDTATSSLSSRGGSYAGAAGTPVLLEPILLSKFLATLAVLVHASRHAPAFLAVIVPEVLAFVLAIKPGAPSAVASARARDDDDDSGLDEDLVAAAALELVLVALDATVQLDGGRTLMSSSAASGGGGALVVDVKDWAEEVFEREERRGGVGRAGRAAAGVLLRVEEVSAKWRLSVGW
ncbi:telomere binding protein [Rhodotorula kratochvilovae]